MEINKYIIDTIEDLRPLSNDLIDNNLAVNVPTIMSNFEYIRKTNFKDSHRLLKGAFSLQDAALLLSYNIPFNNYQYKPTYMDTLDNLVRTNKVYPFLFFINGVFIKWSELYIIKDCRYSYILIPNHPEQNVEYQMIMLPKNIIYDEKGLYDKNKTLFSFKDGYLYNGIDRCVTINKNDSCDFYYEEINLKNNSIQHFKMDPNREMYDNNMIIFKNNLLYTKNFINHGLNMFSVDDNILSGNYIAKGFFYYKSNLRRNNNKVIMDKSKVVKETIASNKIPRYLELFKDKFNFSFDIKNNYENNILRALYYIMNYNSGLMNRVYEKANKSISRIYTGKELKKLVKKGNITMSRRINNSIYNYIIIFHNGELYKYYHELSYHDKNFTFPFKEINDNDTIELLYFLEVDNRAINIKFGSKLEDLYYLDESINMDYMRLYTMQPEKLDYNIEITPDKQYQIAFHYEKNNDGTYIIYPDKPFYYDKKLFLVSERQFRYLYHICEYSKVDLALPMDFKFCDNPDQYLVFLNKRKIDKTNYRMIIPREDNPYDDISIYFNILLNKDDILEIFYIPDIMKELQTYPDLDTTGDIIIDKTKFRHNISKDLNFIFINGKKIPRDWIYDVDQNRVKLTTDPGNIHNLCIIQHIKEDNLLYEIFRNTTDLITNIIDSLSIPEYKKIIQDINITNKENSIITETLNDKQILYRLVRDYYCAPFISTGDTFLFNSEDLFEELDSDGNIIIRQDDANLSDKLGKEESDYEF